MSVEQLAAHAVDPELSQTFHPQIDGYVLPASTAEIFARGRQAPVPLIVGSNADEGSVLYHLGLTPLDGTAIEQPATVAAWDALLTHFGSGAAALEQAYAVDDDGDVVAAAEALMGDAWFGRHAYYMAQDHSRTGQPTYLYFYERNPPAAGQTIGASHALELAHVFGGFLPFWPWNERDDELVAQMQGYWSQFARSGNPNAEQLPQWARFDRVNAREMAFADAASTSRAIARKLRYEAMAEQFTRRLSAVQAAAVTTADAGNE